MALSTLDRLRGMLGEIPEDVTEVRLRAGRPAQFRGARGDSFGEIVEVGRLRSVLAALADHSLHAHEAELREGFFTMGDGCRVGVCGRLVCEGGRVTGMASVGSVCVRICREVQGAADGFYHSLFDERDHSLRSALIVSPPGMGKTTALRDAARRLSEEGFDVCIADERHELAACVDGVPTLDVGPRTDVMDGCPKRLAVACLLRAASPQVIVTDEIGGPEDVEALSDAVRCGVRILASAHAGSIDDLLARRDMPVDVFDIAVLLGKEPGNVVEIRAL